MNKITNPENQEILSNNRKESSNQKNVSLVSTILLLFPWTILPLRTFVWALETPAAQIIVICYALLMIFSGFFTIHMYRTGRGKGLWMQICTIVCVIYAAAAVAILALMVVNLF